ncbi:MAG: MmgE/PrpD family protein [Halobacteria archaeon]|nr:MmgE/PrpD family protein [Halobacteria archaeon]
MRASSRLEEFSEWASGFSLSDAPDDVVDLAKLQVGNILAASIGSLNSDVPELTRELRERAPEGDATVVGGGLTDVSTAYYLNSTYSMHHDYDDYLFMAHTGHSAVLASLAVAESEGLGTEDLLRGVVVANELEGRLGASVVVGPHNGQMWSFVHGAGAAAATAVLNGGDADDVLNSVSLVLYNPPFPLEPGFMGGDSKSLTASSSGASGIRAGYLALSGATGSRDVLDAEKGFFDRFSYLPFPEMLSGFGESWVTRSLSLKPYPGCAYVQTPLELIEGITEQNDLSIDDIESVTVDSSLLTLGMETMSRPHRSDDSLPPSNATFSVPYSLALSLVDVGTEDGFGTRCLERSRIHENLDRLNGIASRVELRHSWEHTVKALDGLSRAVPMKKLLDEKPKTELLSGLRRFRDEHSRLSTKKEVLRLLTERRTLELKRALDSPIEAEGFDLSCASFDDLEFRFSASVEVETRGGTYRDEAPDHSGACGRGLDERREVVSEKLRTESADCFDESTARSLLNVVEGLESAELVELSSLLRNP